MYFSNMLFGTDRIGLDNAVLVPTTKNPFGEQMTEHFHLAINPF